MRSCFKSGEERDPKLPVCKARIACFLFRTPVDQMTIQFNYFDTLGELPYDFPDAESSTDLYRNFEKLVQKRIFTYFVLRGEVDQDIKFSHKLVPGLLLRSLVLRTGGDFFTLGKWVTKRIKKVKLKAVLISLLHSFMLTFQNKVL